MEKNDSLTVYVKPGSKIRNLLPFAIKMFQAPSCRKVMWQSLQGATAKTVTCAEQFKQSCLAQHPLKSKDPDEPNPLPTSFTELFQSSRIFLQKRDVVLADAGVQYTLEEAAITVVISKDPISEDASSENVILGRKFHDFVASTPTEDKTSTRKRLKHTKKRKRELPQKISENRSKLNKKCRKVYKHQENAESSTPGLLSFLSPRLAPGLEAAKKSCDQLEPFNTNQ